MSSGRGRGYTGRHHLRETKPGDETDDMNSARTLAELTPRSTAKTTVAMLSEVKGDDEIDTSGDEEALQALLKIDEEYAPLLLLLEQFTPGEDGIQFNRKFRHFETSVTELCPDETRLQNAFRTFRAAALQSSVTSRKLATVGAAFTRQQRQGLLRASLLNVMQATFSSLEVLERANPMYLINAANLIGDYFAEARLCNGKKVHVLGGPLFKYMKSLLASDDIRAHRSLATQLMQNGRELLSILPQQLDELSISIRLRLLTPPPISIIWLLLSSDLCLNKFLPLPNTMQQFYAAHLDLASEDNFSEVSYGSWKKDTQTTGFEQQSMPLTSNFDDEKPKLRPILGAGAGLKDVKGKRLDLNSWRQEVQFNPSVPPPNIHNTTNYDEFYNDFYQQGDGTYIQNLQNVSVNVEKVNSEVQKSCDKRCDDTMFNDNSSNYNEKKRDETNFNDRRSDDIHFNEKITGDTHFIDKRSDDTHFNDKRRDEPNFNDIRRDETNFNDRKGDDTKFNDKKFGDRSKSGSRQRLNRRNSGEIEKRRHVSDVPRNHKYWDHDDRCDKDYNS